MSRIKELYSELRELWGELDDYENWVDVTRGIKARLT